MLVHFLPNPSIVYHVVEIEITPSRFSKIYLVGVRTLLNIPEIKEIWGQIVNTVQCSVTDYKFRWREISMTKVEQRWLHEGEMCADLRR